MSAIDPNPVSRVAGAPPAPAAAATGATGSPGNQPTGAAGGARPRVAGFLGSRNGLLIVGAGLVAAFALGSRGKGGADDQAGPDSYEIDTTQTDLYNELQPELENISDQLGDLLQNGPRPQTPTPVPPTKPTVPKPAPKPAPKKYGPGATGYSIHTVKAGETLGMVARLYQTWEYSILRANYKGTTRLDGTKGFMLTYGSAKPGTRLVIPNSIKTTKKA